MSLDDSKKKILARRASFIAAAMASVACQKEPVEKPEPCLAVPIDYKPDAEKPEPCLAVPIDYKPDAAEPMPCLSVMRPPEDAGAPAPKQKPDAGAKPKLAPPPLPHPCLTPKRPDDP